MFSPLRPRNNLYCAFNCKMENLEDVLDIIMAILSNWVLTSKRLMDTLGMLQQANTMTMVIRMVAILLSLFCLVLMVLFLLDWETTW